MKKKPKPASYNLAPGFVWGAATAAYQIEGSPTADGRGPSIWEKYFRDRPHLDNGEVSCDHYNRMEQDVQLMKDLGLKAYRFSISWSRIIPKGKGKVNERGVQFYERLVDTLLAAGIEPYATLYHWDLPQALEDKGGWLNRDTGKHFARYAKYMVQRLGDRVSKWTTFNEPEVIVAGYIGDGLAPGLSRPSAGSQVAHNLLVAHGRALQVMRSVDSKLQIGIVLNLVPAEPLDPSNALAVQAAELRFDNEYGKYLDALLTGAYSDAVLSGDLHGPLLIEFADMDLISQKIDYLGVNYYLRHVVNERGEIVDVPGADVTQMGWEIHPASLSKMLIELKDKYLCAKHSLPPVYITENGAALDDTLIRGRIQDLGRIEYLHGHLLALKEAASAGVDLRGYFVWSLLDNLEWSLGFAMTFGLIHVDRKGKRPTLKRTVKDSGLWYKKVIRANSD